MSVKGLLNAGSSQKIWSTVLRKQAGACKGRSAPSLNVKWSFDKHGRVGKASAACRRSMKRMG